MEYLSSYCFKMALCRLISLSMFSPGALFF